MNEEFFFKWVKVFLWIGEGGGEVTNLSALSHTGMINHSLKSREPILLRISRSNELQKYILSCRLFRKKYIRKRGY